MGSVGSGYTRFSSEAETGLWAGHYFAGDGKEVNDFFRENTNNYDLIQAVFDADKENRRAFDDWAVGHFMDGQQYDGFSNMSAGDQARTRIYDKWLDQSVINKGFVTRRLASAELLLGKGNKTITESQLASLVGNTDFAKGNMSTSAASTGLDIGWGEKPIEYVFSFPKGSKGAGMWIGDYRINDEWGNRQREFMTNRDSAFKVTGYKWNPKRNIYEVEMKWTGKLDHDYT